ncbi:MAG TPA: VTT domain-containing protein [Terriglobales bacterium]|nr:VTT domain-containing protein [Terriglobales bacterium]
MFRLLTLAAKPARPRSSSLMRYVRHLGLPGLFLLAIMDSTPIPTLGGVDILLAILAARHVEPWWTYAMVASVGSVIGAYITFHAARVGGADYLRKKFGEQRVTNFLMLFDNWGTSALVVTAAVPFPFPTSAFFAAAGVLEYPARKFLAVVAAARGARYLTIALVAFHYGRHFIRALRNPAQYYGWLIAVGAAIVLLIATAALVQKRLTENYPTQAKEA